MPEKVDSVNLLLRSHYEDIQREIVEEIGNVNENSAVHESNAVIGIAQDQVVIYYIVFHVLCVDLEALPGTAREQVVVC